MLYTDLLTWWAVSISWSAFFLIAVSLYLYRNRRKSRAEGPTPKPHFRGLVDFVFVWVLVGLLGLYIISIYGGSSLIFAAGNIIVEIMLIIYTLAKGPK